MTRTRATAVAVGLVLLGLGTGCASSRPLPAEQDLGATLARHGLSHPFEPDEELVRHVASRVRPGLDTAPRVQALLEVLLNSQDGLGVKYRHDRTLTAAEVFRAREGNCVSLVNLFVAASRSLGLQTFFVEVDDYNAFRKDRGFVVNSTHVVAGYREGARITMIDFLPGPPAPATRYRQVSDVRAAALYHNNKAVELLMEGQVEQAERRLESVVAVDPSFARAWNNLGICRGRLGRLDGAGGAIEAFRRAAAADPSFLLVHENLAAAYKRAGEQELARAELETLRRLRSENPFFLTQEADEALRGMHLEEAEKLYRAALRRDPKLADPHVGLARLALARGDERGAERQLRTALRLEPEHAEARRLLGGDTAQP